MTGKLPPTIEQLLRDELEGEARTVAVVLAGHNGSGKSTLWYQRLAGMLQIPLVNADRLTMSILPEPTGTPPRIPAWAQRLRDEDATFVRAQRKRHVLFDTRAPEYRIAPEVRAAAAPWLEAVVGPFKR